MLIELAPPAIKYPPTNTQNTSCGEGNPKSVTNMGTTAVSNSSEMTRGLVRPIRSRHKGRVSEARVAAKLAGMAEGSGVLADT